MIKIIDKVVRQIISKRLSTFFVNAPPGAGKTHLLMELSQKIPDIIVSNLSLKSISFGPYSIPELTQSIFFSQFLKDLEDSLLVKKDAIQDEGISFLDFFLKIEHNIQFRSKQFILIFYDLEDAHRLPFPSLVNIFSQARALGEKWFDSNFNLLLLFAGSWNHQKVIEYFESIHTSWPYIPGENYCTFQGIDPEEILKLVSKYEILQPRIPYQKFLFELSGGHPGCAIEIMNHACQEGLSFSSMLAATRKVAEDGEITKKLLDFWTTLPKESRIILIELLKQKNISSSAVVSQSLSQLLDYGLVNQRIFGDCSYLSFRSWYMEMAVYYHVNELGICSDELKHLDFNEIIPYTSAICIDAYKLINRIENLVRNYVSAYLWKNHSNCIAHPLMDKLLRFSVEKGREDDAYERTQDWKENNLRRGVSSANLNPTIAFLSTSSLADLVREIGVEINSQSWIEIADAIKNLSGVRDAIMHNQIIDDVDLGQLYEVEEEIYRTLSK